MVLFPEIDQLLDSNRRAVHMKRNVSHGTYAGSMHYLFLFSIIKASPKSAGETRPPYGTILFRLQLDSNRNEVKLVDRLEFDRHSTYSQLKSLPKTWWSIASSHGILPIHWHAHQEDGEEIFSHEYYSFGQPKISMGSYEV